MRQIKAGGRYLLSTSAWYFAYYQPLNPNNATKKLQSLHDFKIKYKCWYFSTPLMSSQLQSYSNLSLFQYPLETSSIVICAIRKDYTYNLFGCVFSALSSPSHRTFLLTVGSQEHSILSTGSKAAAGLYFPLYAYKADSKVPASSSACPS